MWFWWFLLICDLLIPAVMVIGGRVMQKHCPQTINHWAGYRTKRSMQNMDTWKFAHEYCGRLWWKVGLILLIPSVLVHIPFYRSGEDALGIVSIAVVTVQCVILIATLFPAEAALKKTFHEDGTRRSLPNSVTRPQT